MRSLATLAVLGLLSTACTPKCGVAVASEDANAVFSWTCDTIDTIEVVAEDSPEDLLWRAQALDGQLSSPISFGEALDPDTFDVVGPTDTLNKDTFYRVTILDCRDDDLGDSSCRAHAAGDATFEWVDEARR